MNEKNKDNSLDSDNVISNNNRPTSNSSNTNTDSNTGWHKGYVQGNTFSNKEIKYRILNEMAMFEGDIILARDFKEMEKLNHKLVKGVGAKEYRFRWPYGEIPYIVQSTLPNRKRIVDAIKQWESKTPIRFIFRTESNASYYPNYVSFVQYVPQPGENQEEVFHCSSPIGMRGGEQPLIISDQCITGDVIHEIGHAVGLWHEQSREDRDNYIRILWDNVQDGYQPDGTYDQTKDMRHNFDQHITDGDNIGDYDYCSIMHYGAWFFSKNRQPTIDVIQTNRPCGDNQSLGQKNGLSPGDISSVIEMYSNITPTVIRNPHGILEMFMVGSDGHLYSAGQISPNSNRWGAYTDPSSGWVDGRWLSFSTGNQNLLGENRRIWSIDSNPAIAENADGRLEIFMIGSDQRDLKLYNLYQNTSPKAGPWAGAWYGSWYMNWNCFEFPQQWVGGPVVAQNADGRLEVFVVDPNGDLYHIWQADSNQINADGLIMNKWSDDYGIGFPLGKQVIPGSKLSARRRPAIAKNADGRLEVFGIGLDGNLYHTRQTAQSSSNDWSDWTSLGGTLHSNPVVAQNADGRLEVFAVAQSGELYHLWQTGSNNTWSSPTSLGGQWSQLRRPAVAKNADGRLEVFMMGSNRQLYHILQTTPNSSQWAQNWTIFSSDRWPFSSNPATAQNADGRLEVFMMGSNRQLYHSWQTTPNGEWDGKWAPLGEKIP